ncbi:MAG: putative Ig domain-containing protein [Anaerolineae bacterium]|nr:putative Ig domain-containing protein [Anaerolineae bacterium]
MVQRFFSGRNGLLRFVILVLTIGLSVSGFAVQAEGSAVQACAVTPNLIGGQGFSISGQGFSVSGQGFSVSGQGLDPLVVAAEIRDNPVTPGKWVDDRLQFFLDRLGFNTEATAILVIDEFNAEDAHGVMVQKVVEDSLATLRESVPDLNVAVFPVDISDSSTNYNADVIAGKIATTIDGLRETYNHFVLNMSFGLIACEDEGPVVEGEQLPPFDFNQAVNTVEANNEAEPTLAVEPILECVRDKGFGLYVAYFGYKNENAQLIDIPVGSNNKFDPYIIDVGQPTDFEPGRQSNVFAVVFKSYKPVTWTLRGPDGETRSVTATSSSTPCENPPAHPSQPITPILECVADLGEGLYEARFGYNNPNELGIKVPVSWFNRFSPHPEDRGQVTTFAPGLHESVFTVNFNGSDLIWKLTGNTVTANASSPVCPEQEGFGVGDYLTQNLGVPEDKVEEYWAALGEQVAEDELQTLRTLLQGYLADSADPDQNFSAVTVASSGNFRPWLGAAPLAPASWPETIAVGASLNDSDNLWSFSQDANVVAPGAGYPLDTPNSFAAGTSFAAPAFSVLVGMCSTVPGALDFDGVNPPLLPPVLDSAGSKVLNNAPIGLASFAPLACSPNRAPVIDPIADRTDPEGTNILLDITATDPDENPLTFSAVGLPPGITIDSQGRISGLLSNTSAGEYDVTVTVTDSNTALPGTDDFTFHWTVTESDTALEVDIDIKPLSPFNRINLKSHGRLSVAILSSETFDARTVNPRTVTLAGSPVVTLWGHPVYVILDVNHDGRKDLVVRVKIKDMELTETDTEATLEGETFGGQAIVGTDFVTIVPPHAPYLTSPLTGTSHRTRNMTLTWEAVDEEEEANTCFVVQIDNNSNFSSPEQSAISVGLPRLTTYSLANGTYNWRVAVSNCSTEVISDWSQVWTFTIRR